jgi:hypothetical protein
VDISFAYLAAITHYVSASGDVDFARTHWPSIASAYHYCLSLIGPDGLPHIPAGKEGGDEQHRPAEDLSLSTSWVAVTRSFAVLARGTDHAQMADEALKTNQLARKAIAAHFWDQERQFWIDGYTAQGAPIFTRRSGPGEAILQNIFSQQQNDQLLDQLASSNVQTDWGARNVGADSSIYDPWSYASGSVSGLHSADLASLFWMEHRPNVAWSIWRSLVPWNALDSLGHMNEVLAGNYYREQTESVPEQTWSSAGLLNAAVQGLLGLEIDGADNSAVFRPHLPSEWDQISVSNVHLPHSILVLTMREALDSVDLKIENSGSPMRLLFDPQIPLGAHLVSSTFNDHTIPASSGRFGEDEHVSAQFEIPSGVSRCHLQFSGGVSLILPQRSPNVGDPSSAMKVLTIGLQDKKLVLHMEIRPDLTNTFRIRTPWRATTSKGATVRVISNDLYEAQVEKGEQSGDGYRNAEIEINFAVQ